MTRSELIKIVSKKHGQLSEKTVELAVKSIFEQIIDALESGHRIEIRGFGSFSLRYHPSYIARNPKTGECISTAAKYSSHFKPGKEMRERVNHALLN